MKAEHKVGLVLGVILLIILAYYNGAFTTIGYPPPGAQQPGGTTGTAFPVNPYPGQQFFRTDLNTWYTYAAGIGWQVSGGAPPVAGTAGTYTVIDVAYNTLDISSALTLGTNVDQSFWAYRNGWILLGGHGASGTNIELTQADQGYIYIMMVPHTTSTYIADVAKTMAMNSRALQAQFADANQDNLKEFMVKWSMANVPAAASGYPSTTFTGYYLYENSASSAITAGTNLTGVTTAAKISYFASYMVIGTVKRGVAVTKVELKCNTTSTATAALVSVNVPGKGLILASACDYQMTDSYQIWDYVIGTDLSLAVLWEYGANTFDKQDLTFGVQTTLASGDVIVWTLKVYQLNYAQTVVTATAANQMTYA
jgi:hypothetical protein